MNLSISDWAEFTQALPIATHHKVGLEILEFALPEYFGREDSLLEIIRQQAGGIDRLSMHGPFSDLVPASRDPLIREVTLRRYRRAIDLAQSLSASHLILHSGFIPKTYTSDVWLENSLNFWIELLSGNIPSNLIHVENVYESEYSNLLELIERVNQALQREVLTLCLDIGHVKVNSSRSYEDWITALGDRIRYVHLHNNAGVQDDHWALHNGSIDVARVLELLVKHSPNATWTIETSVADIELSLEWMRKQGYL
jgi:sugar phosphate isomerase/epimerase